MSDNISEQERQLIEIIRENAGADDFLLSIRRLEGVWDILLSVPSVAQEKARGTGTTFAEAWDNTTPPRGRPSLKLVE